MPIYRGSTHIANMYHRSKRTLAVTVGSHLVYGNLPSQKLFAVTAAKQLVIINPLSLSNLENLGNIYDDSDNGKDHSEVQTPGCLMAWGTKLLMFTDSNPVQVYDVNPLKPQLSTRLAVLPPNVITGVDGGTATGSDEDDLFVVDDTAERFYQVDMDNPTRYASSQTWNTYRDDVWGETELLDENGVYPDGLDNASTMFNIGNTLYCFGKGTGFNRNWAALWYVTTRSFGAPARLDGAQVDLISNYTVKACAYHSDGADNGRYPLYMYGRGLNDSVDSLRRYWVDTEREEITWNGNDYRVHQFESERSIGNFPSGTDLRGMASLHA